MADDAQSKSTPQGNGGGQNAEGAESSPQLRLLAQYAKDLSFENPNAPGSLTASQTNPKIDIAVDVQATPRSNTEFEVELKISATAKRDEEVSFIVELSYCGLFLLANIPADQLQPVILIECPRLLFPFARRVVADATRDGGFPPLMIDPIDFVALYQRQLASQQAAQGQQAADQTPS